MEEDNQSSRSSIDQDSHKPEVITHDNTYIVTDDTLKRHGGLELIDEVQTQDLLAFDTRHDKQQDGILSMPEVRERIIRNHALTEAATAILYLFVRRMNQTVRPVCRLTDKSGVKVRTKRPLDHLGGSTAFMYMYTGPSCEDTCKEYDIEYDPMDREDDESHLGEILLFFKYFDVETGAVSYVTSLLLPADTKYDKLVEILNAKMGFPPGTQLVVYEHVKPRMDDKLVNKNAEGTLEDFELGTGDIVVFEKVPWMGLTNKTKLKSRFVQFGDVAKHLPPRRPLKAKPVTSTPPSSEIIEYLASLYKQDTYSDVTFVVGGIDIPAHKVVIARVPYFHAMLQSGMKESQESRITIDAPLRAFETVLQFLYTGSVADLTPEDAEAALVLAGMYSLESLGDVVSSMVRDRFIRASNAVQYLVCAHHHQFPRLKKDCLTYILGHFTEVAVRPEFASLSEHQELFTEVMLAVGNRIVRT